jgi:hypothetical protein
MKRAALSLLVAVVVLLGLPAPAWAQGNQRFIGISTIPGGNTGTVVGTGPITGVGTFVLPEGQGPGPLPAQFSFTEGTVFATIVPNPPVIDFNPRTCLVLIRTSGTFEVTGGTGPFAGASGGGTFAGRAFVLLARAPQGECQPEAEPQFFFGFVENTGNVTLGGQMLAA